jgi:hypothetical protein
MAKFINPAVAGPTGPQGPAGNGASTDTYDKLYVTNNGAGTNVKIGDDAWIGDVNIANHISVQGVEDATKGGIVFGNGLSEKIQTDGTNLSLIAENDIILNPGSDYAYIGSPTVGGETRIAQRGYFGKVDRNVLPAVDNEYTLGSTEYRWKNVHLGQGTIYITDASTGDEVALTIDNGVFFIDGIAQAQLPALIANNIELHDGNDNVVMRLVEESGTGKLYFGGGSNGIWQDGGKTYITGIGYHSSDSGFKPMYYNSSTGEVTYDSDAIADTFEYVSGVPVHNYGAPGDEKNNFTYDSTYLYVCIADYVNNSTVIWKRISWASGNW